MAETQNLCDNVLNVLEKCITTPDLFVKSQPESAIHFKALAKQLYGMSMKLDKTKIASSKALPKLLISGFDEEQIWQQLELRNVPALKHFEKAMKELNLEALASSIPERNENIAVESDDDHSDEEGYAFDDDSGDDSDMSMEVLKSKKAPVKSRTRGGNRQESEVDDQFFKLSQMEEFLKKADLISERTDNLSDDESNEIDYYAEISSDDAGKDHSGNEDEENEGDSLFHKDKKDVMYEDFFDPPNFPDEDFEQNEAEENDNSDDENELTGNSKEYDTRDYDATEEMEVDPKPKDLFEDDSLSENENSSKLEAKTAFEKQQEKDQKRIKQMEENLLLPKPWQLTGEVDASHRPENSLLRQPTTFDVNPKQNNIESTADLTSKIEDIIKMAISNKAWMDVERKIKPKEDAVPYKRRPELDQTKSKKGLAEIYEEDYLKLKHKPEEEEDPRHAEIQKLMDTLTPELYALFSHIPKPPVPEIKVVNNLPAISVEEVGPVGLSNAALLAPEEVKKKTKGDIKGDMEKSATDKKRERRKKKLYQKLRQKKTDEKMKTLAASNPKLAKKQEQLAAIKKLKQHKNTVIVNKDEYKKVKSSKEFFSRLDETVHSKKTIKLKK